MWMCTLMVMVLVVCVCVYLYRQRPNVGMYQTHKRTMKVVCAWCGEHMKGDVDATLVSHGICIPCAESMHRKIRLSTSTNRERVYSAGKDAWSGNPETDKAWYSGACK